MTNNGRVDFIMVFRMIWTRDFRGCTVILLGKWLLSNAAVPSAADRKREKVAGQTVR